MVRCLGKTDTNAVGSTGSNKIRMMVAAARKPRRELSLADD